MYVNAQNQGLLTLGNYDSRITRIGFFLRRYKIDEISQLINILIGNMSFVGPRPELRYFVNFYKEEDHIVFSVRPGITSPASLKYRNEVELLKTVENPESFFITTILPHKIKLNKEYIKKQSVLFDIKLVMVTIAKVWTK